MIFLTCLQHTEQVHPIQSLYSHTHTTKVTSQIKLISPQTKELKEHKMVAKVNINKHILPIFRIYAINILAKTIIDKEIKNNHILKTLCPISIEQKLCWSVYQVQHVESFQMILKSVSIFLKHRFDTRLQILLTKGHGEISGLIISILNIWIILPLTVALVYICF